MVSRLSGVVVRLLLCFSLSIGLSGCARASALLEAGTRTVERHINVDVLPLLPAELILEALRALDRGDLAAVRARFASGAPAPDAAVTRLRARWPGALFGQPAASVSIGPHTAFERFTRVPLGQIETIAIRGRCATGTLEARIIVQMTPGGWRLFDVQ